MPARRCIVCKLTLSLCLSLAPRAQAETAADSATATASTPAARPAACDAAAYRQFDFWVGQWSVFDPTGKKVGESQIESIDGGCAILERWRGAGGFAGTSLNSWHAPSRQWHQHWVDNQGGLLRLAGALEGSSMVLASAEPHPRKPGVSQRNRITWTPLPGGAVRQHWEQAENDGAWTTAFDGRYVRRP